MFQVQMPSQSPLLTGLIAGSQAGANLAQLPGRIGYQNALNAHQQSINALPFGGAYASGATQLPSMLMSLQKSGANPGILSALQKQMQSENAYKQALALSMGTNTQLKNLPAWAKTAVLQNQAKTAGNLADNRVNADGTISYSPASQLPAGMSPFAGLSGMGSSAISNAVAKSISPGMQNPAGVQQSAPSKIGSLPTPTKQQSLYSQPNAPVIGQNQSLSPAQQVVANAAGMAQLKETAPSGVLERIPYANQLEQSLNQVPLDSLTYYAGPGKARFARDLALYNQNPKEAPQAMNDYINFVNTTLPAIGKQAIKFWGASVRPASVQQAENMVYNPKSWMSNPSSTLSQFNNYRSLIGKEAANLKQSATNPDIYTGASNVVPSNAVAGTPIGNQAQQVNQAVSNIKVGGSPSNAVNIPTFNTKAEFQSWYAKQDPATKASIRSHLSSGGQ